MDEPTRRGMMIDSWQRAIERVRSAERELLRAECALTNARNELGKWMMPDDAKEGEKIGVWHGASLICVEKLSGTRFKITIRKSSIKTPLVKP